MHRPHPASLATVCLTCAAAFTAAAAAPPPEIVIPGEHIFPESITSSADGTVIIGSIGARTIFRARPGAAMAQAWIAPGTDEMQSIFGVFADDASSTLWACSQANPFGPQAPGPHAPAALYAFDLKSGAPKGHYPFPSAGAFCNDIAVGADGTAYATDTNNMEVVRLKKGTAALEVWAGSGAFGPRGGVLDGIAVLGKQLLVNTLGTSKLFTVAIQPDGSAGAVALVKLDQQIERPDGMRSFGAHSLLIAEGGGTGRLSRVDITGNTGRTTTLKLGYPDGPVAVTVVGTTAYLLEGQLSQLMRPGGPDPSARPRPFRATAVEVGTPH